MRVVSPYKATDGKSNALEKLIPEAIISLAFLAFSWHPRSRVTPGRRFSYWS